jgi:DNA-binding response OmpR family regulator
VNVAARPKILLVEDEYLIAAALESALLAAGYDVLGPAPSVRKALGALAGERPAGAILDVNLRGETVFAVADALAASAVPFVFCTGRAESELPAEHRARPVVQKPCDAKALLDCLAGQLHAALH